MPKLFCIPMLFKDNMDIVGTATTNGATGLADNFPVKDGHQVSQNSKSKCTALSVSHKGFIVVALKDSAVRRGYSVWHVLPCPF